MCARISFLYILVSTCYLSLSDHFFFFKTRVSYLLGVLIFISPMAVISSVLCDMPFGYLFVFF